MRANEDMIKEVENKIAHALRRTDPNHPEYSDAWTARLESFQAWHQRLLGNE